MTTAREGGSPDAQNDLDGLLNVGLGVAQERLATRGAFVPFAAAMNADGEVTMINGQTDPTNADPTAADVIAACKIAIVEQRASLCAAAIVADVRLPDIDSDAIQVELEHSNGNALTVQLPYQRRRFRREVDYGELRGRDAEASIWAS